jgi:hypothetical protein
MTEPVSFALALAGIPSIFVSCVDCLQYIRLGRRFQKDFGFCLAKIEAAQLRLTRWGEPFGLLESKFEIQGPYEEADVIKAYNWLTQLEAAFEEAKETSDKYSKKQKERGKQRDLEFLNEDDELAPDTSTKKLVVSMKEITNKRQKHLSLPRKITWALYGKDSFDSLTSDIVSVTNNLVELFPATNPRLQELCLEETNALDNESVLQLVQVLKSDDEESNNTDDPMLSRVIEEYIEAHRLEFRNITVDGSGTNQFGDEYGYQAGVKPGSIKVDGMSIKGTGHTHAGHTFYGSQGAQGMRSYARDSQNSTSRTDAPASEAMSEGA